MKEGDRVILDKEFNNRSEVTIVIMRKYFSLVKDDDGYQWETMTSRLSSKETDETLLQGNDKVRQVQA